MMGSCEVHMSVQCCTIAALLGRKTDDELGVLRVGLAADMYFTGGLTKEKLREMYHQAFTGLGKLKNYQLKLHIDECNTCCPTNQKDTIQQKRKGCAKAEGA